MRSLANISMVIILLIGTFGVTVNKHYCGGQVYDIAINESANSCGMEKDMPAGCCHNESEHFEIKDKFQSQNYDVNLSPTTFVLYSIAYFISDVIIKESAKTNQFLTEIPPPLSEPTIYLKVQSFLL